MFHLMMKLKYLKGVCKGEKLDDREPTYLTLSPGIKMRITVVIAINPETVELAEWTWITGQNCQIGCF